MGWQIYPWPSWLELDPYNASAFGAALRARLTPFLTRMQAENGAPPTHRRRGVHLLEIHGTSRAMHLERRERREQRWQSSSALLKLHAS